MIQTLKAKLIIFSSLFFVAAPALAGVTAYAADQPNPTQTLCSGSVDLQLTDDNAGTGCAGTEGAQATLNDKIAKVINILSIIVGIVAVIMIIVGGFRYITSGGNTERVSGAKNTILYGIIGLVIVALAQIIVKFVLNKSTTE